jgi:hypothetical protein
LILMKIGQVITSHPIWPELLILYGGGHFCKFESWDIFAFLRFCQKLNGIM